jgi:hypothetical protein
MLMSAYAAKIDSEKSNKEGGDGGSVLRRSDSLMSWADMLKSPENASDGQAQHPRGCRTARHSSVDALTIISGGVCSAQVHLWGYLIVQLPILRAETLT